MRIVRTFEPFREPIFRPSGTVPCAPWLRTPRPSRRLFSCCCSPPFLPRGNLVRIVRTFKPFREPLFLPSGTVPCAPWLRRPRLSRRLFSCYCSPPFLPRGNLVRIVRTFEPFREPFFLPPDTVLRADAAMGGIQKVSQPDHFEPRLSAAAFNSSPTRRRSLGEASPDRSGVERRAS